MERLPITPANIESFLSDFPDHGQRYEFALPKVKGLHVADIACGAGYGTAMLAKVATHATGFDIDQSTVDHANAYFSSENCIFLHSSKMSGSYDVITSFETLEHMNEQDGDIFLQILHKNLKKVP